MMRGLASAMALLMFAGTAAAQPHEVFGQAGVLGEWEITATVTEGLHNGVKQFVGPLSLKHVGLCTVDGPEEKTGELRLRILSSSKSVEATLQFEDSECTFSGKLEETYDGVMTCPDKRAVPLNLWIK
jgi:hypothetical protein